MGSGIVCPSGVCPHLSLNSSKVSSWCSARRREEVLKLGRAATRGRAADRRVVARKKVEAVGPRAAIRRKDMFFFCSSLMLLLCTRPLVGYMGGSDGGSERSDLTIASEWRVEWCGRGCVERCVRCVVWVTGVGEQFSSRAGCLSRSDHLRSNQNQSCG